MNASAQKKLRKIDVLIKKNASDWFQQMKSHLHDEKQWKIIRKVITEQERETAEAAAQISDTMSLPAIPEETPEPALSTALDRLVNDKNWDAKNWKAISIITALLKLLNQHMIRKYKYVRNIWIYLTEFYKQNDQIIQMIVLKKLIIWKMNSNHIIKKVSQEISFITDQIHQIKKMQSFKFVEILFLNSLSK